LIERKAGSGTFVKNTAKEEKVIKLLMPVADMNITPSKIQYAFQQYQNGIIADMRKNGSTSLELVAISNSNKYEDINKQALNRIDENDKLIIDGSWFLPIMKHISLKNCEVVYISADQLDTEYTKIVNQWHCFYYSIPEAFEKIVMHLTHQGYKRIVIIKPFFENEDQYPLQFSVVKSLRQAVLNQGLIWKDSFHTPFHRINIGDVFQGKNLTDYIKELYATTKFDAIITYGLIDIIDLIKVLEEEIGLSIPGDVGLISWEDIPELSYLSTPVSALKLPFFEMGKAASHVLLTDVEQPSTTIFSTQLVVRKSTTRQ
jgi:DNA-binding LacI/PurR family transcriptional regulator